MPSGRLHLVLDQAEAGAGVREGGAEDRHVVPEGELDERALFDGGRVSR